MIKNRLSKSSQSLKIVPAGKNNYRDELECKIQQNNVKVVWSRMGTITKQVGHQISVGSLVSASDLNLFSNRFNSNAPAWSFITTSISDSATESIISATLAPFIFPILTYTISSEQVRKEIGKFCKCKAVAPCKNL